MKIFSVAPCRLGLYGGGTDVSPYSEKYGGMVINMAINIRQEMTLYTRNDIYENPYHKVPIGADPKFIYKILDEFGINGIHHSALTSEFEGIIGAGLGSSAACTVALVAACSKALNLGLSREDIAERAWDIETNIIGHYGGKQDHYASAFGGFNLISFYKSGASIQRLNRDTGEKLAEHIVLFDTGVKRKKNLQDGFKELTPEKIDALDKIKGIVNDASDQILIKDYEALGQLLDEAWRAKKRSNSVSSPEIDEIYQQGIDCGAWGGKLLGSGGGGYMIFMVDPAERTRFIENMGIKAIDFSIDWNGVETKNMTND